MNREIKFRGKRKGEPNEWLIGDLNFIDGKVYIFPRTQETPLNSTDWFEIIAKTVSQFIIRKNTEDGIYEGDYDAEGNMIDYCDNCMGYQFFQIDIPTRDIIFCHNCDGNFMLQDYLPEFEPIGNIHDNTELINECSNAV